MPTPHSIPTDVLRIILLILSQLVIQSLTFVTQSNSDEFKAQFSQSQQKQPCDAVFTVESTSSGSSAEGPAQGI